MWSWTTTSRVLYRNSLVLALHAMACVAGFMAGSSIPLSAANRSGLDRWVHEKAGRFAIAFVVCATTFSLVTQAYIIGGAAATYAGQLGISPALLIVGLLPHALPELVALFLPLAAWLIASRSNRWEELLAATVVTVAIAVPMLLLAVVVELHVSPMLLEGAQRASDAPERRRPRRSGAVDASCGYPQDYFVHFTVSVFVSLAPPRKTLVNESFHFLFSGRPWSPGCRSTCR